MKKLSALFLIILFSLSSVAYPFTNQTNGGYSTISNYVSASATTITVANTSTFPQAGNFIATLWSGPPYYPQPYQDPTAEVALCSVSSPTVLTCARAQEAMNGQSPTAYPRNPGDQIANIITAGKIGELQNSVPFVVVTGAKGDGITNDTAAFQAAINAANGGTVYAPIGTFRVNLNITSGNLVLMGASHFAGWGNIPSPATSTVLVPYNVNAPVLTIGNDASNNIVSGVTISEIGFNGAGAGNTLIQIQGGAQQIIFDRVWGQNATNHVLQIGTGSTTQVQPIQYIYFNLCTFQSYLALESVVQINYPQSPSTAWTTAVYFANTNIQSPAVSNSYLLELGSAAVYMENVYLQTQNNGSSITNTGVNIVHESGAVTLPYIYANGVEIDANASHTNVLNVDSNTYGTVGSYIQGFFKMNGNMVLPNASSIYLPGNLTASQPQLILPYSYASHCFIGNPNFSMANQYDCITSVGSATSNIYYNSGGAFQFQDSQVNANCTSNLTPYACCSGNQTGTCTQHLLAQILNNGASGGYLAIGPNPVNAPEVLTINSGNLLLSNQYALKMYDAATTNNSQCTAVNTPLSCCSGNNAGTCPNPVTVATIGADNALTIAGANGGHIKFSVAAGKDLIINVGGNEVAQLTTGQLQLLTSNILLNDSQGYQLQDSNGTTVNALSASGNTITLLGAANHNLNIVGGASAGQSFYGNAGNNLEFTLSYTGTTAAVSGSLGQTQVTSCTLGVTTNSAGVFNGCVTSDERLKKDIYGWKPLNSKTLMGLKVVHYKWKDAEDKDDRDHVGLIAQDVEKVLPEAVTHHKVAGEDQLGVDPNAINALLIEEVQRLYMRISRLEKRVKKLLKRR